MVDPGDQRVRVRGQDAGGGGVTGTAVLALAHGLLVARRRPAPAAAPAEPAIPAAARVVARDPVCGMAVPIATARHRSESPAGAVYFFCAGCQARFDREPGRYAVAGPA